MTLIRLPSITADNYESIRSLLKKNVPDSYNQWLDLRKKWLNEYAADTIIHVNVNPNQFSEYIDRTGRAHDLQALMAFIAEINTK